MRPKPIKARNGGMNKTEAAYAKHLEIDPDVVRTRYEPVKFRIAKATFYTPDFMVVKQGHIEFVEIKGFLRDDANVKFKAAAEMYPEFLWKMIRWDRKEKKWETMKEI